MEHCHCHLTSEDESLVDREDEQFLDDSMIDMFGVYDDRKLELEYGSSAHDEFELDDPTVVLEEGFEDVLPVAGISKCVVAPTSSGVYEVETVKDDDESIAAAASVESCVEKDAKAAVEDLLSDVDPALFNLLAAQAKRYHCSMYDVCRTFQEKHPELTATEEGGDLHAHLDGGAQISITNVRRALFAYRSLSKSRSRPMVKGIDSKPHETVGYGYLKIQDHTDRGYSYHLTFHCPTVPATIVSPFATAKAYGCKSVATIGFVDNSEAALVTLRHCQRRSQDITIPCIMVDGLLLTSKVVMPTTSEQSDSLPRTKLPLVGKVSCDSCAAGSFGVGAECNDPLDSSESPSVNVTAIDDPIPYTVQVTTRDQLRVLWHQRLCHIHSRRISEMHKLARGVPPLPIEESHSTCPICARAKLTKAVRSKGSSSRATQPHQGISVDFGFVVQTSSDAQRKRNLAGLNGETCYCLIVDHYSGALYGQCFASKNPPLQFLKYWLTTRGLGPDVPDKYVMFDRGGELGHSEAVVDLFAEHGYRQVPTATNASYQNGLGERPHRTIGDGMRTLLHGAALPYKFWPYAFHHFLRVYNFTPHRDDVKTPYEIISGRVPNLQFLRTFGCRMYVANGKRRSAKCSVEDTRVGTFLGYAQTSRNFLFFDSKTQQVSSVVHATFDEAMNDLPFEKRPPNAQVLCSSALGGDFVEEIRRSIARKDELDAPYLDVTENCFNDIKMFELPLSPDMSSDDLGLEFQWCTNRHRLYLSGVSRSSPLRQVLRGPRQIQSLIGSYLVRLNDTSIYTAAELESCLQNLFSVSPFPASVKLQLAPEPRPTGPERQPPLHLRIADLRRIHELRAPILEAREGTTAAIPDSSIKRVLQAVETSDSSEQHTPMTEEERKLPRFTRRYLKTLPQFNWLLWSHQFDSQLDSHDSQGTFGYAMDRPPGAIVLRPQWVNVIKKDGRRKCRLCCDGSKRAAPMIHALAPTYASCIEQPCMRLFYAIAGTKGLIITGADCTNAYANAPPPTTTCYLEVDEAFIEWHGRRYKDRPQPKLGQVVPILRALQGHPEAGALWEKHIVGILVRLGFTATTHERNLYHGVMNGETIYVARQVDDFAIASRKKESAVMLIEQIRAQGVEIRQEGDVCKKFNGVDVDQTREYVRIHCKSYIDRVLKSHGWIKPNQHESDRHDVTPISDDTVKRLSALEGPASGTKEHAALERDSGFPYRQVLGELIYAYVVCRLDIGYAITFLARFADKPHAEHYQALRKICKYLRATSDWGLVYWRPLHLLRDDLPEVPFKLASSPADLPSMPSSNLLTTLHAYLDASYGTDQKTRKSITGYAICYGGAAICYRSTRQTITALSSTEAEFIASVSTAKKVKYLRAVLLELALEQKGPTPLFCDNESCIKMINNQVPTERSRHIDVRYFAIQEWRSAGEIELEHIPGVINPADDLTKATGPTLHYRHCRRVMGHHGRF
jgi:hypothetical protein